MVYKDSSASLDTGNLYLGSRQCKTCKQVKDINNFHFTGNKIQSRRRVCKACQHEQQKLRGDLPEIKSMRRLQSYKAKLKTYGLTSNDFEIMLEKQQNKCKICSRDLIVGSTTSAPHVDHCHVNGSIRGILCFTCNTALGKFGDNVETLARAIDYLNNTTEFYRINT